MGAVKQFIILSVALLSLTSCFILNGGYTDKNGQYVPKHPRFKLKDKKGFVLPPNLDTNALYKLFRRYSGNILNYPKNDLKKTEKLYFQQLNSFCYYTRFYDKGRYLRFSIPNKSKLSNSDLNPNNSFSIKGYYYVNDGKNISRESFVPGEGEGRYVITKYFLVKSGDTIIYDNGYWKEIYVKQPIPADWPRYKVDW